MAPRPYAPRKLPSQKRSKETVDAIVEGAIRIFEKEGFAGSTIPAIAGRAGVSVGSLYQYFPNKLSLLAEAKRRYFAGVFAELEDIFQRANGLHDGMRDAVAYYLCRCRKTRTMLLQFAAELPARTFDTEAAHDVGRHVDILRQFFERNRAELPRRDPAHAALIVSELVRGASLEFLRHRPDDLWNASLESELETAILSYLKQAWKRPSKPAKEPVCFFGKSLGEAVHGGFTRQHDDVGTEASGACQRFSFFIWKSRSLLRVRRNTKKIKKCFTF